MFARILRELAAGPVEDEVFERLDDPDEVAGVQPGVVHDAVLLLDPVEHAFEECDVDTHDGIPEHLHESTVGIPGEALPLGGLTQSEHRQVVQTDVQDGLHHARHGERRRADRQQQRVVHLPQPLAGGTLQRCQVFPDLAVQILRGLAGGQEVAARLGGDGEAGRNGQSHACHLREVGALVAEQIGHVTAALGEVVHVGTHDCHQPPRRNRALLSHWLTGTAFPEGPDGPSWGHPAPPAAGPGGQPVPPVGSEGPRRRTQRWPQAARDSGTSLADPRPPVLRPGGRG